jgi:DNA mismatch endonuclease (patch repair protein)
MKLKRNQERDRDTVEQLMTVGWSVVRVWEHESSESAAERIAALVNQAAVGRGLGTARPARR